MFVCVWWGGGGVECVQQQKDTHTVNEIKKIFLYKIYYIIRLEPSSVPSVLSWPQHVNLWERDNMSWP